MSHPDSLFFLRFEREKVSPDFIKVRQALILN